MNFKRVGTHITVVALALVLSACAATSPGALALAGDPRPLMQLVMADKVDPNQPIPVEAFSDAAWPPLCVLVNYVSTEPAVVRLLERGADINGPCRSITPLDILYEEIVTRSADTAPGYRSVQNAEQAAFLMSRAQRMIASGARQFDGPVTPAKFRADVNARVAKRNELVASMRAEAAQKQRESWFTAENLAAAAQAAGAAANQYTVGKRASALPAQSFAGTANTTTQPSARVDASAPARETLVVESNPYVVDQRPQHWRDKTVSPWHIATGMSPGTGRTRKDACESAQTRGEDTIKSERMSGIAEVTSGLTECVCHNEAGTSSTGPRLWSCDVYYQYKLKSARK